MLPTGYDMAHPMLVVLDCEGDVDLKNMYKEKHAEFEQRMQDVAWLQKRKFFIIDGAHRHHLAVKFKLETVRSLHFLFCPCALCGGSTCCTELLHYMSYLLCDRCSRTSSIRGALT